MPQEPNKLSQFWHELMRRKVVRVIIMYAGVAYIITELVNNISEPLYLPDWIATFVILILILGFPIIAILSWIFDVTPEGLKKTEPVAAAKEKETETKPTKRKLKASDVIITILVVVVGILVYPKIFKTDKLASLRDEEGRISITVMPFVNLTGDTLNNVWQGGFQNLIISTLSNSEELLVRQYQAIYNILEAERSISYASLTPSLASELALKLDTRTFIIGNMLKAGNKIRVNAQLINAETEEIYKTYQVDGNTEDDIFSMADSLSRMIQNHLEIKKLVEQYDSPAMHSSLTNSSKAFQYFIRGYDAVWKFDPQAATEWLTKAIKTDPNFISAYVMLSFAHLSMGNDKLAKNCYNMAVENEKRHELSMQGKLMLDHLKAYYYETPYEQIRYIHQILEIDELNSDYWFLLGSAYYKLDQHENAAINFEKVLEIHKEWGTHYKNIFLYAWLGDSYHKINDHNREKEIYELGLSIFPDHPLIIRYQATCALSQGDCKKAGNMIAQYRSIRKNNNMWTESRILSDIGYIYSNAGLFDEAEPHFRQALSLDPKNPERMNDLAWFLIDNDIDTNHGMKIIELALKLEPENSYYLDTRGWGLNKQGRYEEALLDLRASWDLRPAYEHEIYQHIQEVEQAIASQNQ